MGLRQYAKCARCIISILLGLLFGLPFGCCLATLIVFSQPIFNVLIMLCSLLAVLLVASLLVFKPIKKFFQLKLENCINALIKVILLDCVMLLFFINVVIASNWINCLYPNNTLLLLSQCNYFDVNVSTLNVMCLVITLMCILVNIGVLCRSFRRLNRRRTLASWKIVASISLATLALISSFLTYISVETTYPKLIERLKNLGIVEHCNVSPNIECVWSFVYWYYHNYRGDKGFIPTYGKPCPKPRQLLVRLDELINNRDFVSKLAAISGTGACEDFALAITRLVRDLYGCEIRIVVDAHGRWDHAIPEVKINGVWYVIDITYTTKETYIEASKYAEHLHKVGLKTLHYLRYTTI